MIVYYQERMLRVIQLRLRERRNVVYEFTGIVRHMSKVTARVAIKYKREAREVEILFFLVCYNEIRIYGCPCGSLGFNRVLLMIL